ncbi:MAG: O-antigen translocase [Winogradskyella sp.]|nr:O-antigen translocase [Winogradskyella sp.]NNF85753.1 O-antigen translocase [Winogradskyella sp.]NNK40357.1 O-antigen translocase [Winogradskyella sp.]
MKLPKFISNNLILKITSLNASVIGIRLIVSLGVQRLLAVTVGESGVAALGQIRNVMNMLSSISTLGVFNGIVKYLSEFKQDEATLVKLFSASFFLSLIGTLVSGVALFFGAEFISQYLFNSLEYTFIFKLLAIIVPSIGLNRIFYGVINGLSAYKTYAKIDLATYLLSALFLVICLINYKIEGLLIAVILAPIIQLIVILVLYKKTLSQYITFKKLTLNFSFTNRLLAFTVMSFVSTFLINYIELDIRTLITRQLNIAEAGYWTAMTFISKNYMVFATGLFTLYVLPRFAEIKTETAFKTEVLSIYKTILPIFGVGMVLVYVFRDFIIEIIYPDFTGMTTLFKWQLLGDFIRLCSLVLAHQFIAKKMVKTFVFTEIISLGLFYIFSQLLIGPYGTEGVVIAHFLRYIIYLIVVIGAVKYYFVKQDT